MENVQIRKLAKENGVCLWQVADELGVSEMTIIRKLRHELPKAEASVFVDAINNIAAARRREEGQS